MTGGRLRYPPGTNYRNVAFGHIVWCGRSMCGLTGIEVDQGPETGVTCYECRKRWASAGREARGKEPLR